MSHYHSLQIRNLGEEAKIKRELLEAALYEDRLRVGLQQTSNSRKDKPARGSRSLMQAQYDATFLRRSRLEAENAAKNTNTEVVLARSRIQSAFELRKSRIGAQHQMQLLIAKEMGPRRREIHLPFNPVLGELGELQERKRKEEYLKNVRRDQDLIEEVARSHYFSSVLAARRNC